MLETSKGEGATIQHELVNAGQQILSEYFDTAIRLEKSDVYPTNKSMVVRCRVIDPKSYVPPTFIIKHVVSSEAELVANWVAAQFLSQTSNGLTVTHRFYGVDLNQKIIVLEDLGTDDKTGTQNLVYGNDPIDAPRGPTTRRQQYLAWLDAFAKMTQQFSYLQALGNSSRQPSCEKSGPRQFTISPTIRHSVSNAISLI